MPLYDYRCTSCQKVFEVKRNINDPDSTECPDCKCGLVERYHGSSDGALVQYKGQGWFKTSGKY